MSERGGFWRRLLTELVRIRTRLLIVNGVIVLVPVVGLEWARTYERESLRSLERDMKHQAELLRTVLEKTVGARAGTGTGTGIGTLDRPRFGLLRPALRAAAKRTRMRIRLVDKSGTVVADSHGKGPPEGPEPAVRSWLYGSRGRVERRHPGKTNPGPIDNRREIRAALKGQLGTATRIHERIQRVYLFVAMPIMHKRRVLGAVYITRSTVPVHQSMHRLRRTLLTILAVALGVTILSTLFLAWTISRPLARLTRDAKRIAAGDRSIKLSASQRPDEIGELDRAFGQMVEQLDTRAQYISEMAANISHEFKTPLTSIRGAAELLEDAGDDPEVRRRFLANILSDTQRLDRLVTRILEISRIEATLEQRAPFDLAELVREVGQQFATGARCQVVVAGANAELPYHGNRSHLRSALVAIVENAIRVSPEDAVVRIDLAHKPHRLVVAISDLGPGISEANQRKIFDRFFTTEVERGGTGLGLAIVQTVAKSHGGQVDVQSTLGEGSTFTLTLPC
ncbi:MAG: HAMP domain-containing protein [Myxococcales bacterium]|nr:HAMP domain-containing protein [Myxococcales bacterium]